MFSSFRTSCVIQCHKTFDFSIIQHCFRLSIIILKKRKRRMETCYVVKDINLLIFWYRNKMIYNNSVVICWYRDHKSHIFLIHVEYFCRRQLHDLNIQRTEIGNWWNKSDASKIEATAELNLSLYCLRYISDMQQSR